MEIKHVLNTVWTTEASEQAACWQALRDVIDFFEHDPTMKRLEAAAENMERIQQEAGTVSNTVAGLNSGLRNAESALGTAEGSVAGSRGIIDAAGDEITSLNGRLDNVGGSLQNIESAIAGDQTSPLYNERTGGGL